MEEVLRTWGKTPSATETMRPLDVVVHTAGEPLPDDEIPSEDDEPYGVGVVDPVRHEGSFKPQFLTRDSRRRHWGPGALLNPQLPEAAPVRALHACVHDTRCRCTSCYSSL